MIAANGAGASRPIRAPASTHYVAQRQIDDGHLSRRWRHWCVDIGEQVDAVRLDRSRSRRGSSTTCATTCTSRPRRSVPDEGQGERPRRQDETAILNRLQGLARHATKFIPTWVKVAVAIALGLGTMVGWKRIVVTVGEKIGKTHLTYGQGASAELVAADDRRRRRLRPAGVHDARAVLRRRGHDGRQRFRPAMATVRNLLLAWVLTLPAAIFISGSLYVIFSRLF